MGATVQGLLTLLARVMLSAIFLLSAMGNKIPNFKDVSSEMAKAGMPQPDIMLAGAIFFLVAGSLSVIFGFKARFGALMLFIFLVLATYYFHAFWKEEPGSQKFQMQMIEALKNLAIMGGMLFIIANGPGPMSVDRRSATRV